MYENTYANGTTPMRQRLYILLILRKKCFSVLNKCSNITWKLINHFLDSNLHLIKKKMFLIPKLLMV